MPTSAEQLAADVARAVEIVKQLTGEDAAPKGTDHMSSAEFKHAAGIGVTFCTKVGAVVTWMKGRGFVVKRGPDGKWSAPFFVKVKAGGLGLSLGASKFESLTVLDTPEAVAAFAGGQWTVDTEMSGTVGALVDKPAGGHLGATAVNITDSDLSDKTFTYSVARGTMVDISWTGVHYTPDADLNKEFYGEAGAAPAGVLDGGVPPPEGMAPLFAALDEARTSKAPAAAAPAAAAEPVAAAAAEASA